MVSKKELVVIPKNADWYKALLDDLLSIITEKSFVCNWTRLEMYYEVGQRIIDESKNASVTKLIHEISEDTKICERNLWYAVQAVEKFPDINNLPEGKSMTWSKLKKMLPADKVLAKRDPKDTEDIAHVIFLKYGAEKCKEIIFYLDKFIKELDA